MLVEERASNVVHVDFPPLGRCRKKGASFGNGGVSFGNGGDADDTDDGSFPKDANGVVIYKRRKHATLSSEEDVVRVSVAAEEQVEQKLKQPNGEVLHSNSYEQNGSSRVDVHLLTQQDSGDRLPGRWSSVAIERILEGKIGPRDCTRDAFASSSSSTFQLPSCSEQSGPDQGCASCHQDGESGGISCSSDGLTEKDPKAAGHTMTEKCQRVFQKVLVSESFELLCKLLCENFQGIKVESFAEFSNISSRLRDGTYEPSPTLFHTDVQQVWKKFQKIGKEMVSLATLLSNISRKSCMDQFLGGVNGIGLEGEHEEFSLTSSEQRRCFDLDTRKVSHSLISDQAEVSGLDKVSICRPCGKKANGKDYLVCDLCEEMFHVSCIEPPVEKIPPKNWYCINCTAAGTELAHESCVVCEKLSHPGIKKLSVGDGKESIPEDILCISEEKSVFSMELEENEVQFTKRERILNRPCKLCEEEIIEGQKFKVCEHQFCPFRIFHVHCLSSDQLKYHGPRWYCPSCLCRTCLTDEDDDKIVLCDGCDHAYHMYCLNPPLNSVPKGKWYCKKCDKEIQKMRKLKRTFQKKSREKTQTKNRPIEQNNAVGGSVDMLLSAAEKLKTEETLAAVVTEQ
ncbi:hypothetical protein MKW94_010573 [Papaver nudicaule]|uniref:PHD-type domain-containing protein n=1 Tax=Papaver nudicaule TaxID=74823 RepID=A0AA41SGZ7_PAPNU|nr:hypothetical protein [Papaver nudicaule]